LKFSKLNSLNDYVDNSCDGDDDDDDDDNADYLGNSLWLDYEIFAKTLVKLIVSWMEMEMETEMRMRLRMETVLWMLLKLLLMVSLSGFHFTFKQFGILTVFCFGFVAPTHNIVPLILIVN